MSIFSRLSPSGRWLSLLVSVLLTASLSAADHDDRDRDGGRNGDHGRHTGHHHHGAPEAPILVPSPGSYDHPVPVVVLGRLPGGERLVYTVDGSVPSASAWRVCDPILVTDTTTLRVGVIDAQNVVVRQVAGTYTINSRLTTARPIAAPPGGTYAAPRVVTLTCPTLGATIRFTTDGSEPTLGSRRYTAPLSLTQSTTLRARAIGGTIPVQVGRWIVRLPAVFPSGVMTAVYTLNSGTQQVATPVITPGAGTYRAIFQAQATDVTAGATLRYRTDGSDPSASDPALPAGGVAIAQSQTLTVRGFLTGWTDSAVARAAYILQVPEPTISPASGLAHAPFDAAVTIPTGAVVRYTLDGTDPIATSPTVTGPITIDRNLELRTQAQQAGWTSSAVVAATYTLQPEPPTLSLTAGSHVGAQSVTVASVTPDVVLHFTLDGSIPTVASPIADGPILLPGSCTLQAIASRPSWTDSAVTAAAYTLVVPTPTITPGSGAATTPFAATITIPAGSQVFYTLDGTTPTAASFLYTGPVVIDQGCTLTAIAMQSGWQASSVASATWTFQAQAPTVDIAAGTFTQPQAVTLATTTPGAAIRYTLDGSDPVVSPTTQTASGPISVDQSLTLRAVTTRAGWVTSVPLVVVYTLAVATPNLDLAAGTYVDVQRVHVATTSPGVTLRFTLDGSDPATSTTAQTASGPIAINQSCTLTVIGQRSGWTTSVPVSATYALQVGAVTASLPAGAYVGAQAVTLACATPDTVIHVTLDGSLPTTASPVATSPVALPGSCSLQAIAVRSGWTDGSVLSVAYTLQVPAPTVDVAAGIFTAPISVTPSDILPGVTLRYTLDGTTPTADSPVVTGAIVINHPTTLTVAASRAGWQDSTPRTTAYLFQVATPSFASVPGTVTGSVNVAAMTTSPDASLRYTLDGSVPTASSPVLPVTLTRSATVTVSGFRDGWQASSPMSGSWTVTPTIAFVSASQSVSEAAGSVDLSVHLSDATDQDVTVAYAAQDGTAVNGTDYTLVAGTLTIAAGQTDGVITVGLLDQERTGEARTCAVALGIPSGAALGSVATLTLVIQASGGSGPPPTFTERRSPMWRLPVERFDAVRWANDAAYRTAYLAAIVPERVWETLTPGASTTKLSLMGSSKLQGFIGSDISFTVSLTPFQPVHTLSDRPEVACRKMALSWTVVSDQNGIAIIPVNIVGPGQARIIIGSPGTVGNIYVLVEGMAP